MAEKEYNKELWSSYEEYLYYLHNEGCKNFNTENREGCNCAFVGIMRKWLNFGS